IGHALREHNQEADRLANEAMDKGMGGKLPRVHADGQPSPQLPMDQEFEGIVRGGKVELLSGTLPEGAKVQLRVKK
ncbi:MAG TPA: hypothetical protein VKG86_00015, partial [Terracidiphilus sp.]|nr:hypothetical protein [Terracidiphilus sp.]